MSKTNETIHQITVAQRMGETIETALKLAASPGLMGVSKAGGVASLRAVLEDVTRNIAQSMTSTDEDYRAFMVAAGFESYRS